MNNPAKIGGMDLDGNQLVVEIDKSKFFYCKYQQGQWCPGHWVFGGVECGTGQCFLVKVADRTAATLEQQIQWWILPGTHIVSDGWRAYGNINTINNGVYTHAVINH